MVWYNADAELLNWQREVEPLIVATGSESTYTFCVTVESQPVVELVIVSEMVFKPVVLYVTTAESRVVPPVKVAPVLLHE